MASQNAAAVEASHMDSFEIFCRSLALVGVAELFDKTWFMGLLLALRYRADLVFVGSFLALFLHYFLAAAFGLAFAKMLAPRTLNIMAAVIFVIFAALYAKEWFTADPDGDAIAAGREEAAADVGIENGDGLEEEESRGEGGQLIAADREPKAPPSLVMMVVMPKLSSRDR